MNRHTFLILALLAAVILLAPRSQAATHRVGSPGEADYPTIQEALCGSADGDTILIFPGTYSGIENTGIDPGARHLVVRSVSGPSETVISCGRSYRAFHIHGGQDTTMVIQGIKFIGGGRDYGTAVLVEDGSAVKIVDCVFGAVGSKYGGGAVRVESGTVIINNTEFRSCQTTKYMGEGGGLSVTDGVCRVRDCAFTGNDAYLGGGLHASGTLLTVLNCQFEDNHSTNRGAGLWALECTAAITGCAFTRNESGNHGGAVHLEASTVTATDCSVRDNVCGYDGAQVDVRSCDGLDVRFSNCTMSGLQASHEQSGHIRAFNSSPLVTQCVLAFNSDGPAVYANEGSMPEIANCIVFENAGGDSLPGYHHDNLFLDPLFCNIFNDDIDYCSNSLCLPSNNPWGLSVGVTRGVGCGECITPVEPTSWGLIKAMYR